MLGSASLLHDLPWSWREEHASTPRKPETINRSLGRSALRITLVGAMLGTIYGGCGTVVWSAHEQFKAQPRIDVAPLVVAEEGPAKIMAPPLLSAAIGASAPLADEAADPLEANPKGDPLVVVTQASGARAAEPALLAPEPALSRPAHARSAARVIATVRPLRTKAPARIEEAAPSEEVVAIPGGPSAPPRRAELEGTARLLPEPALKPAVVVVARAPAPSPPVAPALERATAADPPLLPALKPRGGERSVVAGELRAAEPRSDDSFWSRLKALFTPAPAPWIIAGDGGDHGSTTGPSGAAASDPTGSATNDSPDQSGPSGNAESGETGASSPGNKAGGNTGDTSATSGGSSAGSTGSSNTGSSAGSTGGTGTGSSSASSGSEGGGRGGDKGGGGHGGGKGGNGNGGGKGGGGKGGGGHGGGGHGGGGKGGGKGGKN